MRPRIEGQLTWIESKAESKTTERSCVAAGARGLNSPLADVGIGCVTRVLQWEEAWEEEGREGENGVWGRSPNTARIYIYIFKILNTRRLGLDGNHQSWDLSAGYLLDFTFPFGEFTVLPFDFPCFCWNQSFISSLRLGHWEKNLRIRGFRDCVHSSYIVCQFLLCTIYIKFQIIFWPQDIR